MKKIILLSISIMMHLFLFAQGCVAIRSNGNVCMMPHTNEINSPHGFWQFGTSSRYFKSFRHFSGTTENKSRLIEGTEVINHQASLDFTLTRIINDRWSFMVDVPVLSNSRSSLYEHGLVNRSYIKKERHTMHSFGIGDIRLAAYRWLFDPKKNPRGNIQLGLGMKLPTGDYNYKDYWYNVGPNGTKELRTVDQSIQLGDGGTGLTTEINTSYKLNRSLSVYGNFYYLLNPREQNGTRTYRETLSPTLANEAISSVPDQYMYRGGISYSSNHLNGFSFATGMRLEGVPVHDLIGGSGDFRRPGYVWSVEPAVHYAHQHCNLFLSVPFAVVRNRTQSVTDKENSTPSKHVQGDAAFADYTINFGAAFSFK